MAEARTYYDYEYAKGLTRWFIREEIGRGIRELYEVPKELPPKLLVLVTKLAAAESNQSPRSRRLIGKPAHLPQCEATNVAATGGGFLGASKTK